MFDDVYRNRRVLVTGHTGFKGSWLTKWLLDLGAEVAGFSIDIPSQPSLFEELELAQEMQDYRGDVRSHESLQSVCEEFQPEIVFHLAAQAFVSEGYRDPRGTFETNVSGTVNFLEAVRQCPSIQVAVVTSSDKCYHNQDTEHRFTETDPLGGNDPYSASKACTEIVTGAYIRSFFHDSEKRVASVRAGNVIGGGDWGINRLIPDCVDAWKRGESVTLRNPNATRPWQHVLDCLSGYLWVGARLHQRDPKVVGETFNFGPVGPAVPVGEVVSKLSGVWGDASWGESSEPTMKEARVLALSTEKATQRLPWLPCLPLELSIRQTIDWYKAHHNKQNMAEFTSAQIAKYYEVSKDGHFRRLHPDSKASR